MKMYNATISINGIVVAAATTISVDYSDDVAMMSEQRVREMVRFRLNKHWHEYLSNFRVRGETW